MGNFVMGVLAELEKKELSVLLMEVSGMLTGIKKPL